MSTIASPIVAALELAYAEVRTHHPDLPADVMFLIGAGQAPAGYVQHGHFGPNRWAYRPAGTKGKGKQLPEILITGDCLREGAAKTMQILLHEATHALASARKVKDTSRQGRYHNKKFLALAEELGMEYLEDNADYSLGFSNVTMTKDTEALYDSTIAALAEAIKVANLPVAEVKERRPRAVVCVVFPEGDEVEMSTTMYERLQQHLLPHEAHEEER